MLVSRFGQDSRTTPTQRRRRRRLLYVDDVAANVAWLRALLASERVELVTAPTGESAIELARGCRPDLIILDFGLLRARAAEVIRMLRESGETYRIPILGFASAECHDVPGLSMYCRRPLQGPELLGLLHALWGEGTRLPQS